MIQKNLILALNHLFPKQRHPFNLNNDGVKTYAEWQFEKGEETIKVFLQKYTTEEMFGGKRVLDMGCGAGGKSLYYASCGAEHVTGVDIVPRYADESAALAAKLGLSDKFTFVCASADDMPFEDASFDTVIMNDFMEHISNPEAALGEAFRLLAPGGRIYVNFPPYYHPFGIHMSDAINIPWAHAIFSEKALIAAYRQLVRGLPDEKERLSLRLSTRPDGSEYVGYVNRMSIKRFKKILKAKNITPVYYSELPLRGFLKPLARFPLTKEFFARMAVCVIEA